MSSTETTYCVTYRVPASADETARATIDAAPTEGVTLDDVIATCGVCECSADLRDAAGSRRGYVHADGSYTLA